MNEMTWFNYLHNYLELFYFLSGIGLLFIGIFGLKQLQLVKTQIAIAKKEIKVNSQRESALLSAKQCEVFARSFLPKIAEIQDKMDNVGLDEFKGEIKDFKYDENFFINNSDFFHTWEEKDEDKTITREIANLLNEFEAFSVYFTKQIADESIAFQSIGDTFCSTVEGYCYPFITLLGENNQSYANIIELYFLWKDRRRAEELETKLDNLMEEYNNITPKQIRPTGTE